MNRLLLLSAAFGLLIFPLACGSSGGGGTSISAPPGPPPDPTTLDWGGFEPTDEDAAFANKHSTAGSLTNEEGVPVIDDWILTNADYLSYSSDPAREEYILRVDWGRLVEVDNATGGLKFDGSLSTTRGVVMIERAYKFDTNDVPLLPRTSAQEVAWESNTGGNWDGLQFLIITKPDSPYEQTILTIRTQEYLRNITLAELKAFNVTEWADLDSNMISLHGTKVRKDEYSDGLVSGYWEEGEIVGRTFAKDGIVDIKFKCTYETSETYGPVFFGKMVDDAGAFKGLIRGTWCYLPYTTGPCGWFLGVFTDENMEIVGIIGGHFIEGSLERRCMFRGTWHIGFPAGFDQYSFPNVGYYKGEVPLPAGM
ncbi:MAG: hypothetical protein ACYS8W_03825 [Planctomycetota bacterium]|jgi:hypothetical protein